MGERKVLNKYIPADFDPALIPRGKKLSSKDGTVPVRMMLPFTAQCGTCNTFLYRGTKFNSRKEAMGGPDGTYLGIARWRFYIKCTSCSRPITFLTDPRSADYEMESGGTRNYEVYKDKAETEEAAVQDQEEEEKLDPMKALENRVLDSQREMHELAQLEAIRAMNARHVHLLLSGEAKGSEHPGSIQDQADAGPDKDKDDESLLTAEDEALIRSIKFGKSSKAPPPPHGDGSVAPEAGSSSSFAALRRLDERDEERLEQERRRHVRELERQVKLGAQANAATATAATPSSSNGAAASKLPVIIAKKRKRVPGAEPKRATTEGARVSVRPNAGGKASEVAPVAAGKATAGAEKPTHVAAAAESAPASTKSQSGDVARAGGGLSSLLGGYGSDDDSSDE
jgi:hypothetical protein